MKVIILTQYFPPETGAPQNRLFAIARDLAAEGAEVNVLTAMPNYPEMRIQRAYRGKFYSREQIDRITVHRAWLIVSKARGLFGRLSNYFSFVLTSLLIGAVKLRRSDILFVESPPLFLGITAMILARLKRCKLVFNVSDLWPESAVQLGLVKNRSAIKASSWLEMKCYQKAVLITGQTKGIVQNIRSRCPGKDVLWLPNGVDLDAVEATGSEEDVLRNFQISKTAAIFTYAGIIGHAQGLEVIILAAKKLQDLDVVFLLIGDGPVKKELIRLSEENGVQQKVIFLHRMERSEVLSIIRKSSAVVVPLRKNDLFKGAIPSKIFEAMALGKPLLLGVDGEARELFIDQADGGTFFYPEDPDSLALAIRNYMEHPELLFVHGSNGSKYVRENFDRQAISMQLWKKFLEITRK
ncbi:MAG: glycosyltransferase family 4 protein [Bacteroidota bacterium]|nr:glycosyltransferase family 4 protein [Bacteroidota bacterium]